MLDHALVFLRGGIDALQDKERTPHEPARAFAHSAAACDLVTSSAQALAGKGYPDGCVGSFEHAYRPIKPAVRRELENLKVLSVDIRGDHATVDASEGLTTPLVTRDGEWLAASLSTLTCDPARADPRCDS